MLQRSDVIGFAFASLPSATQQEIALTLRPHGAFTDEQRELMENLYLSVDNPATLTTLNEQSPTAQMGVRVTTDGRVLLPVDLLTDCRPGETFAHARDWLFSLTIVEVGAGDFPVREPLEGFP